MELLVLDQQLRSIDALDSFESLIWTGRYCGAGEFEIYTPANDYLLNVLQAKNYLWLKDAIQLMVIENVSLKYDAEEQSNLIVTGTSLEGLLQRRVIWPQIMLTGNLQNGIKKILDDNVINPTLSVRKMPRFIFEMSTDPAITSLTVNTQFTGDSVYSAIMSLCEPAGIGFAVTLTDDDQFKFKLYSGVNRSYDQLINPYVIFSPNFENLISSSYKYESKKHSNCAIVAGEGEGSTRLSTIVGTETGIDRREMFTDARDLSKTVDDVTLSDAEYIAQLAVRGVKDLDENKMVIAFEGKVDTSRTFKYGEDFFLGDIVQIESDYGLQGKTRVTEIIYSQSLSETTIYPTFVMVD